MLTRLSGCFAPVLVAVVLSVAPARAQDAAGWRAYPAFNEVTALTSSGPAVWVGTRGGVFSYTPSSGEVARYTPVEGLRGGDLQTLDFDRARGVLWAGYADGGLDRLDAATGAITRIEDVSRATQYASRGIRRVRVVGDSLYLSTDFGVVVYDAVRGQVRNTYARLGPLNAATPVNDVVQAPLPDGTPGLWAATEDGLVRAPLGADLQTPGAWTVEPAFAFPSFSLAFFEGRVYVGGGPLGTQDLYRRLDDGTWERLLFTNEVVSVLEPDGSRLLATSQFKLFVFEPGQPNRSFSGLPVLGLRGAARTDDGQLWAGDAGVGLLPLPGDPGPGVVPFPDASAAIVPDGPYTSDIEDLAVGPDGTLWLSTRRLPTTGTAAVARLDATGWTNFLSTDPALDINDTDFRGAAVGPDGRFYAGTAGNNQSVGDGLTVFADGVPTLYTVENSTLRGLRNEANLPADRQFVVVTDVAFEDDLRWVVNTEAALQLHLFDGTDTWTGLPTPAGISPSATFRRIVVDAFGQKWIALARTGLAVWDTGADPANPADDRGRQFTAEGAGGQGLPDATVNAVAVDGDGRVWLGTERGVAYVFSPGAAFGGDPSLATPQWPIVIGADGDDEADYLLRDVRVTDLATDPSGRIWVATSSGAYLLNAEGNDVDRVVTRANSPLPTDAVERVAVDPVTGRVYFVTGFGLFSTAGDATRATPSSEALTVSPNPFRPTQHTDGILVAGLNASQSQVRILTLDGETVHAREILGGSFRWDGRDDRSGQPVPSGIYIVASASETGETVYGKVAVIR